MEVIKVVWSTKILDAFTRMVAMLWGFYLVIIINGQRFTGLLAEKIANLEVKAAATTNLLKALVSKYEEIIPRWHKKVLKCTHS